MKDYNNLYSSCSNCKHKFIKEICNECELGLKWEYDEESKKVLNMTDQEKLNFKEKYKNNPIAFIEDFYNVKLQSWQKLYLKTIITKDKIASYFTPYRYGKAILHKGQLEYMKAMEMYFSLWTKDGIEVYEKGIIIRKIEHKENNIC